MSRRQLTIAGVPESPETNERESDRWCTPPEIAELVCRWWGGPPDLDPAADPKQTMPARMKYTIDDNGLAQPWVGASIWLNPPFSQSRRFVDELAKARGDRIAFVKLDPTTRLWRESVRESAAAFCLLDRRVRYWFNGGPVAAAKFPSALVYFGRKPKSWARFFRKLGGCYP
jgi:hypothetical protein